MKQPSALALLASTTLAVESGLMVALAFEDGAAALPEWIQLFPKGPVLTGTDRRVFQMHDPQAVIAAFGGNSLDLPIDWEHAQNLQAPKGVRSPASGWISALEMRDGVLCGRVKWTPDGERDIRSRNYRYISPTFREDASHNVRVVCGAALVNHPHFDMPALASEIVSMDRELLLALGLSETATAADAVLAARALKPTLATFVPRGDYDAVMARAQAAEAGLAAQAKSALDAEISAAVEGALKGGKIAPSSKDYHIAMCRSDGGLALFKTMVAASTSLFTPVIGDRKLPEGESLALTAEEREVIAVLGIDQAEFLARRAEPKAGGRAI